MDAKLQELLNDPAVAILIELNTVGMSSQIVSWGYGADWSYCDYGEDDVAQNSFIDQDKYRRYKVYGEHRDIVDALFAYNSLIGDDDE